MAFATVWQANPHPASLPCGGMPAVVPGMNVLESAMPPILPVPVFVPVSQQQVERLNPLVAARVR